MTGQHRKGGTVTFDANLPAVRKYIDDAIAAAVNQAAHALRAVREWCDTAEHDVTESLSMHNVACTCEGCEHGLIRRALVEEVRNLLPPIPDAAEGVAHGHESDEGPGVPGLSPK